MRYNQLNPELFNDDDQLEDDGEPFEGKLRVVNLQRNGQYIVEVEQWCGGEWVSFEDLADDES